MLPKTIHYCWLSGDPFPSLIQRCMDSWRVQLPEYKFECWNLERVKNIDNEWLRQTIALKRYAFAADFIRVYALSSQGGIYLDADVEVVGSLDRFLTHDFFIGAEYNNDLEPAIFGAKAGHPLLADLLKYYQNRSFIQDDQLQDTRPLPHIFNEIATRRFGFKKNGKLQQYTAEGVVIYPCDYFSPKNIYFRRITQTKNTVAIHHFDAGWVTKNRSYFIKQRFHQLLYRIGGKRFHNSVIQIIRTIQA